MRICILSHNYPMNLDEGKAAAGLFIPGFAKEVEALNHKVYIFTPNIKGKKKKDPKLKICWFKWIGGDKKLGHLNIFNPFDILKLMSLFIGGSRELLKFIKKEKIDTCLALWAVPSGYFAYVAKKRLKIPYVAWSLGSDIEVYAKYPIFKQVIKKVLRGAEFLFADGLELSKKVALISNRKCQFLPTIRLLPKLNETKVNLDKKWTNFLFIGRWEKIKGIDVLIEAMHFLTHEGYKANLYIFGGGEMEEYLKRKIKYYNLEGIVHLGSYLNPIGVASYMEECDCLIIPSRSESIPLVLLEALQMKLPVIVSDVGDMGKLVKEYGIGKTVPSNEYVALKEAMVDFMNEREQDYQKNMEVLLNKFNLRNIAKEYVSKATT